MTSIGRVKAHGLLLLMLGVALLLDASCKRQSGTEASFFPATNQVAGWAKTGDARTFEAADLWKYIDGEAERYLKAGVQRVSTADYKFQDKVDATVDIYTMGNAEGAEKIFKSEPAVDVKPIQMGDGGTLVTVKAWSSAKELIWCESLPLRNRRKHSRHYCNWAMVLKRGLPGDDRKGAFRH